MITLLINKNKFSITTMDINHVALCLFLINIIFNDLSKDSIYKQLYSKLQNILEIM